MRSTTTSFAVLLALACTVGCGSSAPPAVRPVETAAAGHDHAAADHDHALPASFADGVARLEKLSKGLADTMSDEGVHEIGHLLEEVREAAKTLTSTTADDASAISKALDELEECFGKVDEAFHSGDAKADPKEVLESVMDRVEAAFKTIKEVL